MGPEPCNIGLDRLICRCEHTWNGFHAHFPKTAVHLLREVGGLRIVLRPVANVPAMPGGLAGVGVYRVFAERPVLVELLSHSSLLTRGQRSASRTCSSGKASRMTPSSRNDTALLSAEISCRQVSASMLSGRGLSSRRPARTARSGAGNRTHRSVLRLVMFGVPPNE